MQARKAIEVNRRVPLSDTQKAQIVADHLGIERKRMVADERDALIELTVIKLLCADVTQKLQRRSKAIKRSRSRLGLIRWASEWLVTAFMASVPDEQIESLKRNLADSSYQIGTKRHASRNKDDWGLWVSFDDLETITEAGKAQCLSCDLHDGRERACKLRQALDNLGSDIEHDSGKGCGYMWM